MKARRAPYDIQGTLPKLGFAPVDKPLLFASYKVAYEMAKMKNPHNVKKTFIKPSALEMVKAVMSEEAAKKLQRIPLSDNVIRSKVDNIGAWS